MDQIADFVVEMGPGGQILNKESLSNIHSRDTIEERHQTQEPDEAENATRLSGDTTGGDVQTSTGLLVVEEETALGHISWDSGEYNGCAGDVVYDLV